MGMEIHQGTVTGEIVISGVYAKGRIGDGRTRHMNAVNNLLKIRGGAVRVNVVNDEDWMGGRKSETHCLFNQDNQQIT